jgi:hypothetical protein
MKEQFPGCPLPTLSTNFAYANTSEEGIKDQIIATLSFNMLRIIRNILFSI